MKHGIALFGSGKGSFQKHAADCRRFFEFPVIDQKVEKIKRQAIVFRHFLQEFPDLCQGKIKAFGHDEGIDQTVPAHFRFGVGGEKGQAKIIGLEPLFVLKGDLYSGR